MSTDRKAGRGMSRGRGGRLPALLVLCLIVASAGSLTIASLALAHVVGGWGVFFFYTLPTLLFFMWALIELAPSLWRRAVFPFLRARRRLGGRTERARPPAGLVPPVEPTAARHERSPEDARTGSPLAFLEAETIRPWLLTMRRFLEAWRSPRVRRTFSIGFSISTIGIAVLALRHFRAGGWPLAHTDTRLVAAAGALLLSTYAFKAFGWQLLFRPHERPRSLTLAAATGFATVAGVALPGRFDDAFRIAIVRRLPGPRPGVATLALSLFLLGLLDAVALAPFAAVAAVAADTTLPVRIACGVVAFAGVGAGVLVAALPAVAASRRLGRFRIARWLGRHAPTSRRDTYYSSAFVFVAWLLRAAGILLLLDAYGFSGSLPLALGYLAGGAASSALPISPAGAATQTGVGAAVLASAGIGTSEAIAFAIAAQALNILAGTLVVVFTATVQAGRLLQARG